MEQVYNDIVATPPGIEIKYHLDQMGYGNKEQRVADTLGLDIIELDNLLEGEIPVTEEIARGLYTLLGIDKNYWLAIERRYQQNLEKIQQLVNEQ